MPAEWIVLCALLAGGDADTGDGKGEPPPAMEMLEFLGNWQTAKGAPVDPAQFADATSGTEQPSEDKKHE